MKAATLASPSPVRGGGRHGCGAGSQWGSGVGASAGAQAPGAYAKLGDEVVAQVREKFYDAKKGAAWAERHQGYGAAAKTKRTSSGSRMRPSRS